MAGKRKNPLDAWMPPRVYRGKTSYEYRPGPGQTIKIFKLASEETDAVKAAVWAAYAKLKDTPKETSTVEKLVNDYLKSVQFAALSVNTQADYLHYSKRIIRVFGHMLPHDITPPHIRQFMDALSAQGKIVTANRHHSYLSVVLGWGIERGWLVTNPAKQVRKFREKPRDRYIEDWEFDLVLTIARSGSYPYLAPMMEFAYLCRARSIELRALTEADIGADGVYLKRTKGSVAEITGWSDRLKNALNEARLIAKSDSNNLKFSENRPIFCTKNGHPISKEGFKTAWGRVINQAMSEGLKVRFTFHDIKAKGVSDHQNKSSGHKTKKMQAVYDRKPGITLATK